MNIVGLELFESFDSNGIVFEYGEEIGDMDMLTRIPPSTRSTYDEDDLDDYESQQDRHGGQ